MRTLTIGETEVLVVDVPKDAHSFVIDDNDLFYKASFNGNPNITRFRELPEGNWKLLGRLSEISLRTWFELFGITDGGESWGKANDINENAVLLTKQ